VSNHHTTIYNIVKKAHDDTLQYLNEHLEKGVSLFDLNECCILSFIHSFKKLDKMPNYDLWNNMIDTLNEDSDTSDKKIIKNFYTHSIGHHVGLLVHDIEDLNNYNRKLEEGNIITIEPGLYFNKEYLGDNNIPDIYYQIGGVRIENMIYIGYNFNSQHSDTLKGFIMSNYEY
jgi:Xaa-Pro aminopeptidase